MKVQPSNQLRAECQFQDCRLAEPVLCMFRGQVNMPHRLGEWVEGEWVACARAGVRARAQCRHEERGQPAHLFGEGLQWWLGLQVSLMACCWPCHMQGAVAMTSAHLAYAGRGGWRGDC